LGVCVICDQRSLRLFVILVLIVDARVVVRVFLALVETELVAGVCFIAERALGSFILVPTRLDGGGSLNGPGSAEGVPAFI
jgi:hypothetical protein